MTSNFKLQIVHTRGELVDRVVEWTPGNRIEIDIVKELCYRLRNRKVGMFQSEVKVLAAVEEEFAKLLWDLKKQV